MIIKLKDLQSGVQGIYKLNYPNGKIYIGQSTDIKRRMYEHNNTNRLETHPYSACDWAIKKYGAFDEIEILEIVEDSSQLDDRERYWINYYHSNDKTIGYNLTPGGGSTPGEEHYNATMTDAEVLDIRKRRFNGERKKDVYQTYKDKISFSGFEKIWLGVSYPQVGKEYIIPANSISRQEYSSNANAGENNGRAKLTKEDVINIRALYDSGVSVKEIHDQYNLVNLNSIRRVCKRESWKSV